MLAKAYETLENKLYATQFYREALKNNAECHEAFTRLTAGFLLTQKEKETLITEIGFTSENIWLKDYYLSKIRGELRPATESEGHVKLRVVLDSNNSSHLIIASEQDESGMTPPRFQTDFDDSDALRNPAANRGGNPPIAAQK